MDEYKRRAQEAEQTAHGMSGYYREQFLNLAYQWRLLASQAQGLAAGEQRGVDGGGDEPVDA